MPFQSLVLPLSPRRRQRFLVIIGVAFAWFLLGNVPAPYYACEGKQPGDACTWGYGCGSGGACELLAAENCVDNPDSALNECLVCNTSIRPE